MRYATAILLLLVVLGLLVLVGLRAPAASGDVSPSAAPSPSVEPTTTPCPAPAAIVKLALAQYRAADRAWREWRRAKRCLGERPGRRVAGRPSRAATATVWLDHMERWQRQMRDFRARTTRLVYRMTHPGGSSNGVRWKPLMRWLRYPERIIPTFAYIIQRESSGRVRAVNRSSGCSGLLQFQPAWFHGQWGYPAFDPFDPEANLKAGLWLWQRQGFLPWAL